MSHSNFNGNINFNLLDIMLQKKKDFMKKLADVEIKERDLKYNNIDEVINGNAQYGVHYLD